MVITRGLGSNLLVTRGYGDITDLQLLREVIRLDSEIDCVINLKSNIIRRCSN